MAVDWSEVANLTAPRRGRASARAARRQKTVGMAQGSVQANLVILPRADADDFQRFCEAKGQACPLLGRDGAGLARAARRGAGADLAPDAPRYRVYRDGAVAEEVESLVPYRRRDLGGVRARLQLHVRGRRWRARASPCATWSWGSRRQCT